MSTKLVSVLGSRSNGLPQKQPTTANSQLNPMCGVSVFCSPNWWPMDAFHIQVHYRFHLTNKIFDVEIRYTCNKLSSLSFRHDKRRSIKSGGAWLSHAMSTELHTSPLRNNDRMLVEGGNAASNFRNAAMEVGGLLHNGSEWLQRGAGVLASSCHVQQTGHGPTNHLQWTKCS